MAVKKETKIGADKTASSDVKLVTLTKKGECSIKIPENQAKFMLDNGWKKGK